MKTFAVLAGILVLVMWSGDALLQLQERECEYEGLPARCGELLLHTRKDYRTNELHWMTENLRRRILEEGGKIVKEDGDLAVIVARFDHGAAVLASVLEALRLHPAVRAADYNLISVLDDNSAMD